MIVADTSLVVHLFNETELTRMAQRVMQKDPYWILPRLWEEEYANVLSKLARKERRNLDEVIQHFNFTVSQMKPFEIETNNEHALRISVEHSISVYDAHFVALAKIQHVYLITEDKQILKNCPECSKNIKNFLNLEWGDKS